MVFGDKIEWDAGSVRGSGMALCVEQAYLFSDSGGRHGGIGAGRRMKQGGVRRWNMEKSLWRFWRIG